MRNPEKMHRLIAEIDEASRAGRLSTPIQYKETVSLTYLGAVIKEAMRLHPSVGLLLERHVPDSGAVICGQSIPGGTIVGVNAWVTQHDPQVFSNPEDFLPERWLDSSADELKLMETSFFAWGAGSRTCIGRHMATMEMAKVIPQLLREFEISLAYPERPWKTRNVWFVQQEGLVCKIAKRR